MQGPQEIFPSPQEIFQSRDLLLTMWRNIDMLHMNSIRVGLNSEEIVNGLGYEYLLKMMNDILLNFIY